MPQNVEPTHGPKPYIAERGGVVATAAEADAGGAITLTIDKDMAGGVHEAYAVTVTPDGHVYGQSKKMLFALVKEEHTEGTMRMVCTSDVCFDETIVMRGEAQDKVMADKVQAAYAMVKPHAALTQDDARRIDALLVDVFKQLPVAQVKDAPAPVDTGAMRKIILPQSR